MIKAVLFDFDDTLVHTYESGLRNIRCTVRRLGLPVPSEAVVRSSWGKVWNDFVSDVCPGISPEDVTRTLAAIPSLKSHPPVRGVHAVLDMMAKSFVLGIVTGSPRGAFMEKCINAGIDFKKFSFIHTQDDVMCSKSGADYFEPALRELAALGIGKDEVLFAGDSVHDLEAARKSGIHFAAVLTGPAGKYDFLGKGLEERMILSSVTELPHLIENNGF